MNRVINLLVAISDEFRREIGPSLGVTRLVKLLYLLECWYFQQHQKRLTTLDWVYYHYGPYSFELRDILVQNRMIEDERAFDADRTFRRIRFPHGQGSRSSVTPDARGLIGRLIAEWGHKDLYELLNHVYYETAPMKNAARGDHLNIGRSLEDLERPRSVELPRLDPKKVKALKKRLRKRIPVKYTPASILLPDDPDLFRALEGMAREESSSGPIGCVVETPWGSEADG